MRQNSISDYATSCRKPERRGRGLSKRAHARPARALLAVECLEQRMAPAASVSGQVFRGLAAIDPPNTPAQPGIQGVTVLLSGNGQQQQTQTGNRWRSVILP